MSDLSDDATPEDESMAPLYGEPAGGDIGDTGGDLEGTPIDDPDGVIGDDTGGDVTGS